MSSSVSNVQWYKIGIIYLVLEKKLWNFTKFVSVHLWLSSYTPGVLKSAAFSSTVSRPSRPLRFNMISCHIPSSTRRVVAFTLTAPDPRSRWRYRCPPTISRANRSACASYIIKLLNYCCNWWVQLLVDKIHQKVRKIVQSNSSLVSLIFL